MKIPLFKKPDFRPHPQDAMVPLMQRMEKASIAGITVAKNYILLDKIVFEKNKIEVQAITRIEGPLTEQTGKEIAALAQEKGLNTCIVSLASGNCPLREQLNIQLPDAELLQALKSNPKSILKDLSEANRRYALVTSLTKEYTMVFSIFQDEITQIERYLAPLSICRLQNGIYSGLFYLSRYAEIPSGLVTIIDFNAVFFLKIDQGHWISSSYRNFESEEELSDIFSEVLKALTTPELESFTCLNNTEISLEKYFENKGLKPVLSTKVRPLIFAACHA